MRSKVSSLFYVHTEMWGSVFLMAGAVLELACGAAIGFDNPIGILAFLAADLFTIITACMLWGVYRFERRYGVRS